jgi:hypothetical protein
MFEISRIDSHEMWRTWLGKARQKTAEALALDPSWPFAISIQKQLDFMDACVAGGRTPTAEEGSRITLGVMAVRNLEESAPDFATLLTELDYGFRNWDYLPEQSSKP